MSDELPDDAKAALAKLVGGEKLSKDEEALLEQHQDAIAVEADDD